MRKYFLFSINTIVLLFTVGCTSGRLSDAVEGNNIDKAKEYLTAGADPDQLDSLGRPLIITAVTGGDEEIVQLLLSSGANPNSTVDGIPAIILAAENKGCSKNILKSLLIAGADFNEVEILTGTTPLLSAAGNGNSACFNLLINAGADINAITEMKENVAFRAAVGGNLDILNRLIDLGIDLNQRAIQNATPIMIASAYGYNDFVIRLLNKGKVDACLVSADGMTAKDIALRGGYQNLAQKLPDCD